MSAISTTIPLPPMMMQSSADLESTPAALLPVEIIQLIIHFTWALPLSTSERAQLIKSSCLVSLCWMTLFVRESLTDVHLLSGEHALRYDNLIHGRRRSTSKTEEDDSAYTTIAGVDSVTAQQLCRSINLHCIDPRVVPQPPEATYLGPMHPMGAAAYILAKLLELQEQNTAYKSALPNFTGRVSVQFDCKVSIDIMDLLQMALPVGLKGVRRRALAHRGKDFWSIEFIGVGFRSCVESEIEAPKTSAGTALYGLLISFVEMAIMGSSFKLQTRERGRRRGVSFVH